MFLPKMHPGLTILVAQISRHFWPHFFFFCNWILHIWNGFYTWSQSKISFLSPLKLVQNSHSPAAPAAEGQLFSHVQSHLNYNKWFSKKSLVFKWFSKKSFFRIGMWNSRPPSPLHGENHLKFPFWLFDFPPYITWWLSKMHYIAMHCNSQSSS